MRYQGSCHCGAVAFEVEGELTGAVACNCSICARKGAHLWAVPHDRFHLSTPDDALASYSFHKHAIAHRFCRVCGMHPFAEDLATGGSRMAYINIRCLDGVDMASVPLMEFDGRAM